MDIDGDQDLDLFVRDDSDRIFFFENVSPPSNGLDADADGLPDAWEVRHFGDIVSNHAGSDPDDDGLTNAQELDHGMNPLTADTDGDGFLDGTEVELGTLPLVPTVDPPIHVLPASPSASLKFVEVAPASLRLEALLPAHASVQLWHSLDLIRWTPVHGPFMGSGRMQEIVIEGSAEKPRGFYRIEPAH